MADRLKVTTPSVWWFGTDPETLHGPFDTAQEAQEAGFITYGDDPYFIVQGRRIPYNPPRVLDNLGWLFDDFMEANEELCNEDGELSREVNELDFNDIATQMSNLFMQWLVDNNALGSWHIVTDESTVARFNNVVREEAS